MDETTERAVDDLRLSADDRRHLRLCAALIGAGLFIGVLSVIPQPVIGAGLGLGVGIASTGWMLVGIVIGRATADTTDGCDDPALHLRRAGDGRQPGGSKSGDRP